MSDKRRRITLDIWIEERKPVQELAKQVEKLLMELSGATRWRIDIDMFASERPLIGDSDHPMNQRRKNNA